MNPVRPHVVYGRMGGCAGVACVESVALMLHMAGAERRSSFAGDGVAALDVRAGSVDMR